MALHLVALPHTRVTSEFCGCAYTSKVLKFCKMMGWREDVILYAPEGSTSEHTVETVEVITELERQRIFGPDDPNRLMVWPDDDDCVLFNARAAKALEKRYAPGDLVLLAGGYTHRPIMLKFPDAFYCEPGVGYPGIVTDFCAFESHAWRHTVYAQKEIHDGRWFDTVIPNYFDLDDFPLDLHEGGDYLLFLGRVVPRKGPHIALQIAEATGLPLLVAGAGVTSSGDGLICAGDGGPDEVRLEGDARYIGPVGVEERARLLGGARALLAPTTYIEPFGGVAVEAMLAGTPAITSDWGAFTETVQQGITGFRFTTLQEAVTAVKEAESLSPSVVRARASARYSLEAVGPQFSAWFDRLRTLRGKGWYEMAAAPAKIPSS